MPEHGRMRDTWIAPAGLFDGQRVHSDFAIRIQDGRVTDVAPASQVSARKIAGLVTPGFVDLQVNGGGDVLLNQTPTAGGMAAIAAAHRRFGTIAILPTVITDAPEILVQAVMAAFAAKATDGIAGIHIEGPHISVARRGTHAERFIRPMDEATINMIAGLRGKGIAVMITVAPESVTEAQISALASTGAVVSLGHSDVSAERTDAALTAGATCFTHLFNAMSPLVNRAPGMTGAALNSSAFCGLICDGIHVDDIVVGMAIRARPEPDTTFIVSDAMPTVGGSDRFQLYGQELRLRDGRLVNSEGSLAGAHVTMAQSVARLVAVQKLTPEAALRMAVTVPANVIGLDHLARIEARDVADLLVLSEEMSVQGTLAEAILVPV